MDFLKKAVIIQLNVRGFAIIYNQINCRSILLNPSNIKEYYQSYLKNGETITNNFSTTKNYKNPSITDIQFAIIEIQKLLIDYPRL